MKTFTSRLALFLGLAVMLIATAGSNRAGAHQERAAETGSQDKTLSPYFFIKSDDPDTDRLPLKSTRADVRIVGVMADVTITQTYKNEGKNTLEAVYVFPASTRAAVYAMRMKVGRRIIVADIMERKKARQTYEQAKKDGKTASLLEQQRPNVFQMNVANILPGDDIKVELKYTELIVPEEGVYEFVYPAVVGPRYSTVPAAGAPDTEKWVENPYLRQGRPAPYAFGLSAELQTGIPIARLASPSHDVSIEYSGRNKADIRIKEDPSAGTKDFVLRYKLAGGRIETGLMLYPGEEENFFLLMMEPQARVQAEETVPREYIFIVDVSGSMNGFPLDVAKPLMKDIISSLGPSDFMNVLLFAGGSAVLSEGRSLPATKANKARAVNWINSRRGGGGTQILPALKRAFNLPRTEGLSRIVVVVTDGYVAVEPQAFELIRKNLGRANLFTFGIGSSVNRHLIEGMARVGLGEPFVVLNQAEGVKQAARFRRYIQNPVLTGIRVSFEGFEAFDVEPLAVPDLFAQRPVKVFGRYKGRPRGRIIVTGKTAAGDFKKVIDAAKGEISPKNSALRLLWARHKIMRLSDLNNLRKDDRRVGEVTALGLKYSLMTRYTSFVAVDKVRRADGKMVTVKQPLPLPAGVSDLAVGDRFKCTRAPAPGMMRYGAKASAGGPAPVTVAEEKEADVEKGLVPRTRIKLTVVEVRGELDRAVVQKALSGKIKEMKACFSKSGGRFSLGEVTFRFVIEGRGKVKEVKVVTSSGPDSSVAACLKKVIEAIRFTPPARGTASVVVKVSGRPGK